MPQKRRDTHTQRPTSHHRILKKTFIYFLNMYNKIITRKYNIILKADNTKTAALKRGGKGEEDHKELKSLIFPCQNLTSSIIISSTDLTDLSAKKSP